MSEDQALGYLRDILARTEYQVDRSVPWWEQILVPLIGLIWSFFARILQSIGEAASGRQGILGWVVLIACAALLVAVLVYLVKAIRLSVLREDHVAAASLAERRERSDQLWQTAQQLAASGRLTEAVRLVYLSALFALDERALLHVERSLTNREHARRLNEFHPRLGGVFGEVVERYDRVRYGSVQVDAEEFGELSLRVQQVRSAVFAGASA